MSAADVPREKIVAALKAGPPLRLAMIFGSLARGTGRQDSDLDLAIAPVDPDLSLTEELNLQQRLAEASGRDVDLVRLDRASCLVRWQVARDGRVLLESGPFEAARFVAEAVSDYLDFEPAFQRAAALFQARLVREGKKAPP